MSRAYSYEILLNVSYTKQNFKNILEQGIRFGFKYFPVACDQEFESLDDAVAALLSINIYETYSIIGKIDGHIIHIASSPRDPEIRKLGLSIGDFYDIDAVYYMRIFVEMIRNFAICDLKIDIE
ncbi:MAG: hypothetical protein AB7F19_03495 [Candidatus Babeliales bacterium]